MVASDKQGRADPGHPLVSIPFIAGQWSLPRRMAEGQGRVTMFQSPSLRGSGRFARRSRRARKGRVTFQSPSLRGSGRFKPQPHGSTSSRYGFNPLHCGAVVASPRRRPAPDATPKVSIPFIAGQWSLPATLVVAGIAAVWFQSPSLRGSGRFMHTRHPRRAGVGSFNPLHCGAVVASQAVSLTSKGGTRVSIPFIAGQWSLHLAEARCAVAQTVFQSPSLRGSGRF